MKKTVFLIALFLLLKPILPVIDYMVNYEYITKVLCENKDKPIMHCNGKCHLMKELAKNSENEKPISSNKKVASQEFEVLFFQELSAFKTAFVFTPARTNLLANYANLYSHIDSKSVFRPPIFIS